MFTSGDARATQATRQGWPS